MANNFPAVPGLQVAALQYHVAIAEIGGVTMTMPPGNLDLVYTTFVTNNGDGTQSFDYGKFDQDTHETQMRGLLNGLCNAMAANIGVPLQTVQSGITVTRTWIYSTATQVEGTFPTYTSTDAMTYP